MTLTPALQDGPVTVYAGDALDVLRQLPDESVHMVMTSPPYWGLRDYGTAQWAGGDEGCDHQPPHRDYGDPRSSTLGGGKGVITAQELGAGAFREACPKCGAKRTDSQLGLEPTPEEYVENMARLFREVRRVLRQDGTCWLNLGDSYTSGGRTWREADERLPARGMDQRAATPNGLKPKDLVGMPWRVARALQEPYYTGRIRREVDRVWLAATIEAEGCMFLHKRGEGLSNGQGYVRKAASFGAGLEVANTDEAIVRRCMEITGRGSLFCHEKDRRQPLFRWNMRSNECREVIREVYPHLVAKQHEARLLLGCPSSGPKAEAAHAALIDVHHGRSTDVDFPPPESLYEPGWYVRSDIVWSKSNPMPESVTDRPTTSHEHVFLLTRSPRYFYDADAVREAGDGYGKSERFRGDKYTNGRSFDNDWSDGQPTKGGGRNSFDGSGRNLRSVWQIATQPYSEAHFATYPEALCMAPIKAGTSERGCCPDCGAPWRRVVEREFEPKGHAVNRGRPAVSDSERSADIGGAWDVGQTWVGSYRTTTTGWEPTCTHGREPVPCTVLDPFAGSGTTLAVARRLGRRSIGIDLSAEYIERYIRARIERHALPLFEMLEGTV